MRSLARHFLLCIALSLVFCAAAEAASKRDVAKRLEDFRQFFVDFQYAPDSAVPSDLLSQCYGIIIMRQYKAGFVFGVKGGDGVVLLHNPDTGAWSAPGFVVSAEGSFGFQIGGQSIDAIILIMNRDGLEMLVKSRFKVGVDASAAAGPVGRDASAKVSAGTALLAYSRAKGLYAGVAFEGGALLNYDEYNRAMYGMDIGLKDILFNGMVAVPPEAYPLIEALSSYTIIQAAPSSTPVPAQSPAAPMQPVPPSQPVVVPAPPVVVNPPAQPPAIPELEPLQALPPEPPAAQPQAAQKSPEEIQAQALAAEAAAAAKRAEEAAKAAKAASEAADAAAKAAAGAKQ